MSIGYNTSHTSFFTKGDIVNKLSRVRASLLSNPNIQVVADLDRVHLPQPDGHWSHRVDIYVAPKENLFRVDELQDLMLSLFPDPDLKPDFVDNFRESDLRLGFGLLYFDEPIGSGRIFAQTYLHVTDSDLILPTSFVNGKLASSNIDQIELRRRTLVRLFPNVYLATSIAAKTITKEFSISKSDLEGYR